MRRDPPFIEGPVDDRHFDRLDRDGLVVDAEHARPFTHGLYKYFYGEYRTLSKAKEALLFIKKSGYEDAFIREINILISK